MHPGRVGLLMMFAAILKMGAESIANPSKVVSYTPEVGAQTYGDLLLAPWWRKNPYPPLHFTFLGPRLNVNTVKTLYQNQRPMGTERVGSHGVEALGVGSFGVDGAMRARIAHGHLQQKAISDASNNLSFCSILTRILERRGKRSEQHNRAGSQAPPQSIDIMSQKNELKEAQGKLQQPFIEFYKKLRYLKNYRGNGVDVVIYESNFGYFAN
ncbi:hypothetical protein CTI12_AA315100 [Artemisia annua]|uniref:Uncharacterized protein n=1 Tax=Artemisia annua TaxID=35608 RepID=A0A2U1N2K5_ARTAN|nr:hypothetical protein CTI12_AA315100 [Artemisia annua]